MDMPDSHLQKIAILSGKGGTGKTFVSVNLAVASVKSTYVDCDVEEPNGHLFIKADSINSRNVDVKIPSIDSNLCNGCKKCVDFCQFNALAYTGKKVLVFEEVCHSCGGCTILCPQGAIVEKNKTIGKISEGGMNKVWIKSGELIPGEASGVPIIRELINFSNSDKNPIIIDCPPGSSCVVMESIKHADFCILVAESTTFGAHNLAMVHDLVKLYKKPYGVILNKCLEYENPSELYCIDNNIPIIGRIDFDRNLAVLNSKGLIAVKESNVYYQLFTKMIERIREVFHEATAYTKW